MWAALAGLAGSLFSGGQQKKAIDEGAARQERLAKPAYNAQVGGLGWMKDMISRVLMPRLGKESPTLRGQHDQNLDNIGREEQKAKEESKFYNARTGGSSRGEDLRTADRALRATNDENLAYVKAQDDFKFGNESRLWDAVSGYAGQGSGGLATMVDAGNQRTQAASDYFDDIGGLSGALMGYGLDRLGQKKKPAAKYGPGF